MTAPQHVPDSTNQTDNTALESAMFEPDPAEAARRQRAYELQLAAWKREERRILDAAPDNRGKEGPQTPIPGYQDLLERKPAEPLFAACGDCGGAKWLSARTKRYGDEHGTVHRICGACADDPMAIAKACAEIAGLPYDGHLTEALGLRRLGQAPHVAATPFAAIEFKSQKDTIGQAPWAHLNANLIRTVYATAERQREEDTGTWMMAPGQGFCSVCGLDRLRRPKTGMPYVQWMMLSPTKVFCPVDYDIHAEVVRPSLGSGVNGAGHDYSTADLSLAEAASALISDPSVPLIERCIVKKGLARKHGAHVVPGPAPTRWAWVDLHGVLASAQAEQARSERGRAYAASKQEALEAREDYLARLAEPKPVAPDQWIRELAVGDLVRITAADDSGAWELPVLACVGGSYEFPFPPERRPTRHVRKDGADPTRFRITPATLLTQGVLVAKAGV